MVFKNRKLYRQGKKDQWTLVDIKAIGDDIKIKKVILPKDEAFHKLKKSLMDMTINS